MREIPCIFPDIREFRAETVSMVTASATTQSRATGEIVVQFDHLQRVDVLAWRADAKMRHNR